MNDYDKLHRIKICIICKNGGLSIVLYIAARPRFHEKYQFTNNTMRAYKKMFAIKHYVPVNSTLYH
jgi:hypothetical protein